MYKYLLSLVFACLFFTAQAQFPNLVTTDVDGNAINLQEDFLDNGKPVLIHFFAAWNQWDAFFLDTNSLQVAYEVFGPNGTDDIMMLAYEVDGSTTDEDLEGDVQNLDYNFIEAYNFPIINEPDPDYHNVMGINAMPSVILYCPDGTIYVDNSTSTGTSNYPVTITESIFYGELLEPNFVTNLFEDNCGLSLEDETISGHITYNQDECAKDLNNPMAGTLVYFDNGTDIEVRKSNDQGYYESLLPDGTYDLSFDAQSTLLTLCDAPGQIIVNGDIFTDADATYEVDVLCPEIVLDVEPWLIRACDLTSVASVSVCNRGTVDASAFTLNVNFPPGSVVFSVNTDQPWEQDSVTGVFTILCDSLPPFTCKDLNFCFNSPCGTMAGDTFCIDVESIPLQIAPGCDAYIQTTDEDCIEVIGSYDPNDKTGLTTSSGNAHYLDQGIVDLEYMIRFQNTGTDTAFTVRIEDQLSDLYVHESIMPLESSHDYDMELTNGKLTFTFNNILLVDSFKNEPESHGFVTFAIKIKNDLDEGTPIDNTASIFFDSNEPVITNTFTYTTFLTVNNKEILLSDVSIRPNPVQDYMLVTADVDVQSPMLKIMNVYGQTIKLIPFTNTPVNTSDMQSGTYLLQITDNNQNAISTIKKFVVIQ